MRLKNSLRSSALIALATAAAMAPAAQAHVTLQPTEVPSGGFTRLDVRVPNEEDKAATTKVDLQFPPGFIFASYEAVPGWSIKLTKAKLKKPVEAFGEKQTEQVDRVTFTTRGKGIPPGEFQDFGLSLGMPEKPAGTKLTWKALQTYSSGKVVRWIGPPDAEQPAPQVALAAAEEEGGGSDPAAASQTAAAGGKSDDDSDTLAIIALVVGALGLGAGAVALMTARRTRTAG